MANSKFASLGRRGGLRGGIARAASLSAARRTSIARQAARARWTRPVSVINGQPRDRAQILSFVANYGSRVSKIVSKIPATYDLEQVAIRAVRAAPRDPVLTRMLPVFLWRTRQSMDLVRLVALTRGGKLAATLGYFLELAAKLGSVTTFDAAVRKLRLLARPKGPDYFFAHTHMNPFEAMAAEQRTPAEARRWGLLTGTPTDSFETYFRKVAHL